MRLSQFNKEDNMILTAQVIGAIFGVGVAWTIDYFYRRYDQKLQEQIRKQHELDLANYKQQLLKSIK